MRRRYSWYVATQSRSFGACAERRARASSASKIGPYGAAIAATSRATRSCSAGSRSSVERLVVRGRPKLRSGFGLDEPHGNARLRRRCRARCPSARSRPPPRRRGLSTWLGPYQLAWLAMTNRSSSSSRSMISSVMLAANASSAASALEILERHDDDARPLRALRLAERPRARAPLRATPLAAT